MAASLCSPVLRSLNLDRQFHGNVKSGWRDCASRQPRAVPALVRHACSGPYSSSSTFQLSARQVNYGYSRRASSGSLRVRVAAESGDGDRRTSVSTEGDKTELSSAKEQGTQHHKGSLLHSPETNDGLGDFGEETNGTTWGLLHSPETNEGSGDFREESNGASASVKEETSKDELQLKVSTEDGTTEISSAKEQDTQHQKLSLLHSPETNDGLGDFGEETNGTTRDLLHSPETNEGPGDFREESNGASAPVKEETSKAGSDDARSRLEESLGAAVVEAAEKVAEVAVEVVSETVEVAVQTVSAVGEIVDPPIAVEEPVLDQGVAVKTVAFWVSAAVVFGTVLGFKEGSSKASEFFAGYLLEQSLSVDNLFVFVLIFNYFRVPYAYQSRVLTYGIAGAVVFRATMIGLGIASLERFEALNLFFAAILIFSSIKLFTDSEEEDDDLSNNFIVKLCRKILPVTSTYDGNNFLTVADNVTKATPLLLTLIVVELSDIAFAVDSIPAVFGVTRDPFIIFSSNIFAILGLRSLYTIISGSMAELQYLQPSVGVVLGFIGAKMVCEYFGFHVPTEASLGFVAAVLGIGVALSLQDQPKED